MGLLQGRVAIITGGTGALGRAVSDQFLAEGARVAIPWVVDAELPLLEQRLGRRFTKSDVFLERVDVRDEAAFVAFVDLVVERWSKIDALVNLVGGFAGGKPVADTPLEEWDAMFDINLKPNLVCCKAVVPMMVKNRYGRIVTVTSRSGLQGAGDFAPYAVSKGAVATFTSSLAQEVLEHGILVNSVAPSTIDTDANRKAMPKAKHERWVAPEAIAKTIAFLCSDSCQATSGAVVPVYGLA